MARPSNTFDSLSLTIAVTPQIKQYLEDMTLKGTFGSSPAEAARMLLSNGIDAMLNSGALERRKWALKDGELVLVAPDQPALTS
ncbi:hypothetical protein [Prosthecobacter sp.]|uniref:hypothetical protein n=1 Tax=Prosthecobacter sp. TaxID=1965333 RepID=UPI001D709187|nr:hypothetical protein [Prosthecobacter sp.]MCB1278381.1 hypothetical protein [Prosthecobacter sp.]